MKSTPALNAACHAKAMSQKTSGAFSLIEVVLAMGILAFAVIPVVGLLATGLTSAKDSTTGQAVANITRSLRADLQANPGLTTGPQTHYFTDGGYPTSGDTSTNAFYTASLNSAAPTNSITSSTSARVIVVSISYPYPANVQSSAFSFFVAQ